MRPSFLSANRHKAGFFWLTRIWGEYINNCLRGFVEPLRPVATNRDGVDPRMERHMDPPHEPRRCEAPDPDDPDRPCGNELPPDRRRRYCPDPEDPCRKRALRLRRSRPEAVAKNVK